MPDHIHRSGFGDLVKAGGLAARLGMHVERVEHRRGALRRKSRDAFREAMQIVHLLLRQQEIRVGPAFNSLGSAHADESPPRFEDFQLVAVFRASKSRRFRGEVLAQVQQGGARVGDSGGGLRRMGAARGQKEGE